MNLTTESSTEVIGPNRTQTSNTGQAAGAAGNAWTDRDFAQAFTTGSQTGNSVWQVTSVAVEFTFNVASPATPGLHEDG